MAPACLLTSMPFEHIEQRNLPVRQTGNCYPRSFRCLAHPVLMQVIESFQGYQSSPKKQALYGLSVVCSFGIAWLLVKRVPQLAVRLRLKPCTPSDACFILAQVGRCVFCVQRSAPHCISSGVCYKLPCVTADPLKSSCIML